tara:strand:- start:439 stop:672 length:234 start_codon:yes stop_codon:yes gene_type:complete
MNKGHYIWNRAERVDESDMPNIVTDSFDNWVKNLKREWNFLSEPRKKVLIYRIQKERNKMNENLVKLGYPKHYEKTK